MTEQRMAYLPDGRRVEVLAEAPGGGFFVQIFAEDPETGERYRAEIWRAKTLLDNEPVDSLGAEAKKLREEVAALRKERQAISVDIAVAKREAEGFLGERAKLIADLQDNEALRNLQAFIDGKITHFVVLEHGQPRLRIKTFAELMDYSGASRDSWRRDQPSIRLLSLCGEAGTRLSWQVNQYSDGSGGSYRAPVWPCLSEQHAQDTLARLVVERLAEAKTAENQLNAGILAEHYGLPMPDDLRQMLATHRARLRDEARGKLLAQMNKLKAELAAIEAPAP